GSPIARRPASVRSPVSRESVPYWPRAIAGESCRPWPLAPSPQSLVRIFVPMDDSLYFTEHHHQVRELVAAFAREQVAPVARALDRDCRFPWENIKRMGELGLLGVPWPEELGGAGMDQLSYYIVIHEPAKV